MRHLSQRETRQAVSVPPEELRVATFNIHHAAPARGVLRPRRVAATVASWAADVVAIQEVDRRNLRCWMQNVPGIFERSTDSIALFGPARKFLGGTYGNVLLVPDSVDRHEVYALPVGKGREPRCAILADIDWGGIDLTVAGTHLQAVKGWERKAPEAAAQLRVLLNEVCGRRPHSLVMGDMNLRPEFAISIFQEFGFTVARTGPTFSAQDPKIRIDWIAMRGFEPTWIEVPVVDLSDHLPIVADLVPTASLASAAPALASNPEN